MRTLLEGTTEKETGAYGRIRPFSFGTPQLFYCRNLWSSPVGLGISTRLAQAADSLHCLLSIHTLSFRVFYAPPGASLWLHRSTMHLRRFGFKLRLGKGVQNTHMVAER